MTSSIDLPPTILSSDVITLIPWRDHRTDASGHDPRSTYVEEFWLGTLGPTTTWFLRHCATLLDDTDSTFVNLRHTATVLGIGHEGGAGSAMAKTLTRACRFRTVRSVGSTTLAVRVRLPQLSHRQVQRLPKPVQRRHAGFVTANASPNTLRHQQKRARPLAACLIDHSANIAEMERQLALFRFHPAVVAEAVRWAWGRHQPPAQPGAGHPLPSPSPRPANPSRAGDTT